MASSIRRPPCVRRRVYHGALHSPLAATHPLRLPPPLPETPRRPSCPLANRLPTSQADGSPHSPHVCRPAAASSPAPLARHLPASDRPSRSPAVQHASRSVLVFRRVTCRVLTLLFQSRRLNRGTRPIGPDQHLGPPARPPPTCSTTTCWNSRSSKGQYHRVMRRISSTGSISP